MIIRKLTASFGKFHGDSLELQPGLNVIESGNESGKSTWCAFIGAMLYGVDSSAREKGGVLPVKVKYAPWSGAPMEGAMELEHRGKSVTITRKTTGKNAPMRQCEAHYTGTGQPVPDLIAADAGQLLTGVPREIFERSAYIRQGDIPVTGSPELEKRISALVFAGDEDTSYSGADETLRTWLRKRRRALEDVESQMEQLRAQQTAGAVLLREREQAALRLRQAEENAARLQAESDDLRRQQRQQALQEMNRQKSQLEFLQQRYDTAVKAEEAAMTRIDHSPFSGIPLEQAIRRADTDVKSARQMEKETGKTRSLPILILLVLLAAVSLVLGVVWQRTALLGCVICGVLAIALWALSQKNAAQSSQKLKKLLEYYNVSSAGEIQALAQAYERDYQAWEAAVARRNAAKSDLDTEYAKRSGREGQILGSLDFETGTTAAASAGRRLKQAQDTVSDYRARLAKLDGRLESDPGVADGQARMDALQTRKRELDAQYSAILLAQRTLQEADAEIQQVFSPRLSAKASEIMQYFTGGRYDSIVLDRNFSAQARLSGDAVTRRTGYMSSGASDLLYLAVRLAICELVLPPEDCPIILDDTLANIDADRRAKVMDYLASMAKTRQVIVFSCNEV